MSKAPPLCYGGYNPKWPVCDSCAFQPACKLLKEQRTPTDNWRALVYGVQKKTDTPSDPWLEKQRMQARIDAMKGTNSEAAAERAYRKAALPAQPVEIEVAPTRRVFHMPGSTAPADGKLKLAAMTPSVAVAFGLYRYRMDLQRIGPVALGDEYDRLMEAGWSEVQQARLMLLRQEVEGRRVWTDWNEFAEWADGEEEPCV